MNTVFEQTMGECPIWLPVFRVNKVPKRFNKILSRDDLVILLRDSGIFCKYSTSLREPYKIEERFQLPVGNVQFVAHVTFHSAIIKNLARATTLSYRT
jgi:hypothetical protein